MGETFRLCDRDPRNFLYEKAGSLLATVIEVEHVEPQIPEVAQRIYTKLVGGDPEKARYVGESIHGMVTRDSDKDEFSLNHDIYFEFRGREANIFGLDRLQEVEGFKFLLDFDDTSVDSAANLYVFQDEMPFIVELSPGENYDALASNDQRRQYLTRQDSLDVLDCLERIDARLHSELYRN